MSSNHPLNDPLWIQYEKTLNDSRSATNNIGWGIGGFAVSSLGTTAVALFEQDPEDSDLYLVGQISVIASLAVTAVLIVVAIVKKRQLKAAESRLKGR